MVRQVQKKKLKHYPITLLLIVSVMPGLVRRPSPPHGHAPGPVRTPDSTQPNTEIYLSIKKLTLFPPVSLSSTNLLATLFLFY